MWTKIKRVWGCQVKLRLVEDSLDRQTSNKETRHTGKRKQSKNPGLLWDKYEQTSKYLQIF